METPFGVQTPLLAIKEAGGAYSGVLSGATGDAALENVAVDGNSISFIAEVSTPMGQFPVSFRATIAGDALTGTFKTMMGVTEYTGVRE